MVVIVVVVAYNTGVDTAPFFAEMGMSEGAAAAAATVADAAISAGAGNLAGQVAGNIMGIQDGISLKSMVAAGVTGGITAGVTGALGLKGAGAANQMARAAIQSTVGQGVNVALGLQDHFSWTAVAASAIAAPLAYQIGGAVTGGKTDTFSKIAGSLAYGLSHQVITTAIAGGKVTAANVAGDAFGYAQASGFLEQAQQAGKGDQSSVVDSTQVKNAQASQVAAVGDNGIDWNAAERQIQNGYRIAATSPLESNGMVMSTDTPTVDAFGRVVGQGGDQVRVDNGNGMDVMREALQRTQDTLSTYPGANPDTLYPAYLNSIDAEQRGDTAVAYPVVAPQSLVEAKGAVPTGTVGEIKDNNSAPLKTEVPGLSAQAGNSLEKWANADGTDSQIGAANPTGIDWSAYPKLAQVVLPPGQGIGAGSMIPGYRIDNLGNPKLPGYDAETQLGLKTAPPPSMVQQIGDWVSRIPGMVADTIDNAPMTTPAGMVIRGLSNLIFSDSAELGKNMEAGGITRPDGTAAHHIVASGSNNPAAVQARDLLQQWGIGINEADNGVFLPGNQGSTAPGAYHPSLHTNNYYNAVLEKLSSAQSRQDAVQILNNVRNQLLQNKFPK